MIARLRETCQRLLDQNKVQVVIGYGERHPGAAAHPVFITRPEDADQLIWDENCFANLTVYLKRKEVSALGKAAMVVKGCDERALVVLEKEAQVERSGLFVIGMACNGVGAPKCRTCRCARLDLPTRSSERPKARRPKPRPPRPIRWPP